MLYQGAAEFQGRRAVLKWPILCCVPALAGYLWFGWAAALYAFSYVFRAWLIVIHEANPEPFAGGASQVLVFVSTLLWLLCWTYTVLLLINQWHILEKMQFHEAQLMAQKSLVHTERQLAI